MLDLSDLYAFVRITDLSNISAAARSLGSPKSSVSRSLARLEETVGAALMERSTRHLRLTDAGLLLLRHARRILDDVGEAENALGGLIAVPSGTLRVSVPFTYADGLLAQKLPAFLKRYPQVRLVLTVDNRLIDLQTEEIDVAIRIGPLSDSELVARRLTAFALWPCASPAYLAEHGTPRTVQELAMHQVISHADRPSTWRFTTKGGAVHAVEIVPGVVVPEPAVVKTMLIGGAGIGRLPDFHASDAIANGTLVRVLADHEPDKVDAHALYTSHRSMSAKLRVFIDALVVG
jgi:DNA-binding transcriptional LysR family regulator